MKRDKHSLSHYRLLTCDMGKLVPVGCFEVLPGDTVQQATSMLLRVSPLVAPVMHPVTARIHHWFVPYRILWPGWEDFITGGKDGEGEGTGTVPTYSTSSTGGSVGELADYLGIPPEVPNVDFVQFPIDAYINIWNEFYRDQDLMPEIDINAGGYDGKLLNVAWEKDYFTSARPWPQRGPDVSLPLGTVAPVVGTGPPFFSNTAANSGNPANLVGTTGSAAVAFGGGSASSSQPYVWGNTNLQADLSNATAVNINDVRLAFALQRYQEARARYGSRYTEYLAYLGVRSSDARLQRPEYLGGGKQTISFSEILQTGPDADDEGVGQLKGHGIAAMRSRRYRRFFEEHGVVLSLLSVRPRTMYVNALDRMWSRRTKEDYWQRELEQIGQQEVYRREVWCEADNAGAGGDAVFGYQDRYAEYKHIQSSVHGEFRNLLNYWHLGRDFATAPALNQSFVECDPSKRIHAEQTQHSLWLMVNNSIQARRMVRKSSSSRVM